MNGIGDHGGGTGQLHGGKGQWSRGPWCIGKQLGLVNLSVLGCSSQCKLDVGYLIP